jgi:hypothetical protein
VFGDAFDAEGLWPAPDDPSTRSEPRRWVWAAMTPDERQQRMRELRLWVAWLRREHELHNDLPECWYRHRHAREILTALYLGWIRTYAAPQPPASPLAEADWINTLRALSSYLRLGSCAAGGHAPPPDRDTVIAAAASEAEEDFELYLATSREMTDPARHPAEAEARRLADEDNPPL